MQVRRTPKGMRATILRLLVVASLWLILGGAPLRAQAERPRREVIDRFEAELTSFLERLRSRTFVEVRL